MLKTSVEGVDNVTLGIKNLGNTCFFNSTIQCLMATRPFLNYLLHGQETHEKICNDNESCFLCLFFQYAKILTEQKKTPTELILPKLNSIWPRYKFEKRTQEDVNELLIKLFESFTDSCFLKDPELEKSRMGFVMRNESKTPIFQIFGGQSRSQI